VAQRGAVAEINRDSDVIQSKQRPLPLVLGWVTIQVFNEQKPCHTYK